MVSEMRGGVKGMKGENVRQSGGPDYFSRLGITGPAISGADLGFPTLGLAGYETLGDHPNLPVVRRTRTLHGADALTVDRGGHHLKTGGEFRAYSSDGYNHLFARGQASFQGAFTGNPVADLILGLPSISLLGVNDNRQALRTRAVSGFLQDDWRVTAPPALHRRGRHENKPPPDHAG